MPKTQRRCHSKYTRLLEVHLPNNFFCEQINVELTTACKSLLLVLLLFLKVKRICIFPILGANMVLTNLKKNQSLFRMEICLLQDSNDSIFLTEMFHETCCSAVMFSFITNNLIRCQMLAKCSDPSWKFILLFSLFQQATKGDGESFQKMLGLR